MKNANGIVVSPACGVLLFVMACGGGGAHSNTIATAGGNVEAISVNSGPDGNYANGAFTSVTVCVPGTSTCQTISGVLVDTGSAGLRLLSSALTISLPQQKASDGDPVVECLPFVNGYTWGPVATADLQISGEKASSLPIQVLSDSDFRAPTACASIGPSEDTLAALGANGILGVGTLAQDSGGGCALPGRPILASIMSVRRRAVW